MDPTVPLKTLLRWSESLSAIARTGLGFTESLYEQERFEEILKVAGDIRAEADGVSGDESYAGGLVEEWLDTVGKGVPGYVTPKVAVGAAVTNDKGELLLIQRADSGIWLYPTGWCDVGYSAAEVVVKEVEEETGIEVEPVRLIAVLDGLRLGFTRVPLYSMLFLCRAVGGELNPHPLECRDVGWFTRDTLPSPMVGVERWGDHVFAALAGEHRDVLYDSVRQPMWRGDPPQHLMVSVQPATAIDDALQRAIADLVPQLSSSSPAPTVDDLRHIVEDPATTLLLARHEDGDTVVGMLTLAVFRLPTGVRAWIEDVVVDDDARGSGVASALVMAALQHAEERGARTVDLTSRPSREAANRLYVRLGFEQRTTNVYRYDVSS